MGNGKKRNNEHFLNGILEDEFAELCKGRTWETYRGDFWVVGALLSYQTSLFSILRVVKHIIPLFAFEYNYTPRVSLRSGS